MANLSSGIIDGINIGLKVSSLASQKEKDELLMEKTRLDMEQSTELLNSNLKTAGLTQTQTQQAIDLNNIKLGYAKNIAAAELAGKELDNSYTEARIDYTKTITSGLVSDQRKGQITEDSSLLVNILEQITNLPDDATDFELNTITSQMQYIESPLVRSQLKNIDPGFRKSFNNLMPVFQSGDFENAPQSFNEDLTKILKPQIETVFLGADFVDIKGNVGKVQDVVLNGDFIAKGIGDEMILGSKVTVDFGEGGVKEYETFLPDQTDGGKRIFREDLQADDSKAVSVKDTVDYVSGQKHLAMILDLNPRMLSHLQKMTGSLEDVYTPISKTKEAQKQTAINNIYKQEGIEFNTLLASIDINSLKSITDPKDPQMQNALRMTYAFYKDSSGITKDGDLFVTKDGEDPLATILGNAPKYNNARALYDGSSIEDTLNRYNNNADEKGSPTINIGNNIFPFDAPSNKVKESMLEYFSDNLEIQAEIENFDNAFNQAVNEGNIKQSEYTKELKKHIEKALTNKGS